jgi:hypothetical protein
VAVAVQVKMEIADHERELVQDIGDETRFRLV